MQALNGIKVLDFSRVLAGPWCTMTLGDLGADIIKVEPPGGDDTRSWGPPFIGDFSAYFAHVNRNKRSICLNLKSPEGQKIAHELASQCDVVVENFRSGVTEKLGIDYATLSKINPQLVYCSISGYGREGERKDFGGYDLLIQSQGGIMSITGEEQGQPSKVGVAIVDITTGQNAATSILAALIARQTSGEGQFIDISLFDTQVQWLSNVAANVLFSGEDAKRMGNAHANIVPYGTFEAKDDYFTLCVGNDRQWQRVCSAIGKPEWATDKAYATNPARVAQREKLLAELERVFATQPRDYWIEVIGKARVPVGKVHTVKEAIEHPTTHARGMRFDMQASSGEKLPFIGSPLHLSETPPSYRLAPPCVGEHSAAILSELLRYNEGHINELLAAGTINPANEKAA